MGFVGLNHCLKRDWSNFLILFSDNDHQQTFLKIIQTLRKITPKFCGLLRKPEF